MDNKLNEIVYIAEKTYIKYTLIAFYFDVSHIAAGKKECFVCIAKRFREIRGCKIIDRDYIVLQKPIIVDNIQ